MKKYFKYLIVLFLLQYTYSVCLGQTLVPYDKETDKTFKTDKKMIYDEKSSFLFFYRSEEEIPTEINSKRKDYIEKLNRYIQNENNLRKEDLHEKFKYPYSIIYPNELDKKEYESYRYKIFIRELGSSVSTMYIIYVYDSESNRKKRIGMQTDGIDFTSVVDYVLDFIER